MNIPRLLLYACIALVAVLLLPFFLPRLFAGQDWFDEHALAWRVIGALGAACAALYLLYVSAWSLATRPAHLVPIRRHPAEFHR